MIFTIEIFVIKKKIIVIGAGISGLSASAFLGKYGYDV
ncbi:MAG: NAD(P)-binding protein, partial [Bacteroidetes bacterium]|nr:NAD(P)-binding protein [Bacteroidota bacterium]